MTRLKVPTLHQLRRNTVLINGKGLFELANAHNSAVPAFNISGYAMSNGPSGSA